MSNRPDRGAPAPGPDVPSAEVLDELLRAFAADTTDVERLDQVDLESPAVQQLLQPDPHPDVEVESESDAQAELEPVPIEVVATAPEAGEAVSEDLPAADSTPPATIVIDATNEPPDVVALGAPSPGQGSAPGTIFIDDRHTGETVALEAATGAARMEPRIRERRIAVRRAVGRKRLRWVAAAVAVLLLLVAGLAVLGSSLFAIDDVEVEGAVYSDEARLAAVVDELVGTPVLRADTAAAERELERIPWVESARVTTDFPNGAKIELRERTPVVAFQGPDDRWRVIDDDGRVLDVLDSQPVDYLVLVTAEPPTSEPGQFTPQGFGAAAGLVQALTPELRARAQSIAVTPDGSDLRLLLDGGVEVRFGAAQDLVTKLVRLQTRLDQLDGGPMSYVDVSTNEVTTG